MEKAWDGNTYGGGASHRLLTRLLRLAGPRAMYWFTYIFVLPVVGLGRCRKISHVYRLYRRMGMSRFKSHRTVWGNLRAFSNVVIDRFAMYAGHRFDIDTDGQEHYDTLMDADQGIVVLTSHTGNYELAGYVLKPHGKTIYHLVYGGEKESVMEYRRRMFAGHGVDMITTAPDLSHIVRMNDVLAKGDIVGITADRVFGSPRFWRRPFLGTDMKFPQGPFRLAAARGVPVVFVCVVKTGSSRYKAIVRPVTNTPGTTAGQLLDQYTALLEDTVRQYPRQWYNYFDTGK